MGITEYEITPEQLRWQCDPALFDFDCTKDLAPLREFIGQERATRAIEFGLSMDHDGYNIYVAGLTGTGKTSMVKTYLEKLVQERQAKGLGDDPEDWCYVYNFADPDRPHALSLPGGKGKALRDNMSGLLRRLKEELAKAFSSEEYQEYKKALAEKSQAEQQRLFEEVGDEARRHNFALQVTPLGPVVVPLADNRPLSQDEYLALKESARKKLEAKRGELTKKLQATIEKAREIDSQAAEKLEDNDREIADATVSRLFASLIREYKGSEKAIQYISDLKSYTLEKVTIFKGEEEREQAAPGLPAGYILHDRDPFLPFQVNVFVDNSATKGPPVIDEPNPTYPNMFGKIERRFLFGGYLSDHTMLKPGVLHLANGGYLLLGARDVLSNPGVWLALKRAIKTREVRIEDPLEAFGLVAPQGLRPQPVPVEVKIVLIGDVLLYQLLSIHDEDFWEIFKVKADFNFEIDRTRENLMAFAAFIAGCCEECEIRHFDPTGVARVVEYASRMVADQDKLSSRFAQITQLVKESEYWARREGASLVSGGHVETAVEERRFRHNLPDERIRDMIDRGTIMIDLDGAVVGQVNGLSVYMLGDYSFGKPSRITCKTFLGRRGVINIERESQLSGKTHDKGVLILSGYMGWKYAQDSPLSLSASLCFEQSYQGVDGDSASSAELYALLSDLSGAPINQNIAVTGSVNQKGEIQAIGGVNQKIEGFFQVCKTKGLAGDQGVMIPRQNIRNLMLREDLVEAVGEGKFHVYAVSTVDEGIEVLTGIPAGERRKDGTYPRSSINYRVDRRLKQMADKLRRFSNSAGANKKGDSEARE
jgi:predicted ATP-dependent protease